MHGLDLTWNSTPAFWRTGISNLKPLECVLACNMVDEAITTAAASLGYPTVRSEQRDVERAIVTGKYVFVALPTGYGKSLCYAMLPIVFDILLGRPSNTSTVVCVSPLVALFDVIIRRSTRKTVAQ